MCRVCFRDHPHHLPPDLSTSNANPTCAVLPSGRSQLTWTPSPATLLVNQQTVITYNITIPANATPRSLENEAEVTGSLGSSVFNPKDTALLNQSDLGIVKGVSDDGTPEVGDILTYTVSVQNGTSPDSSISITDTVPAFTTFVQGTTTTLGAGAIVRVGTLATVTQAGHGYATGDTIAISGAVQTAYNGGKVITVTGANTYTFKVYGAPVTPATGTITARSTSINAATSVTSITRVGAVATVTTPVAHNYSTGAIVTVTGATSDPTLYNGRFAITVTGATTFTYTMVGTPGTSPATGPITIRPSSSPLSPARPSQSRTLGPMWPAFL